MKAGTEINSGNAAPTTPGAELRIELWIDEWVKFDGTAAQLKEEGLIPEGFEWPKAAEHKRWEANGFRYWLLRVRPAGHKGPPSSWWPLDSWSIRITVAGRDHNWMVRRRVERMAMALKAEMHRHTAAGKDEWSANYKRRVAAESDKRFQAFKALVPGLIPPKRGRKPRQAEA